MSKWERHITGRRGKRRWRRAPKRSCVGRNETAAVEGGGVGTPSQRRRGEGGHGSAVVSGDGDDGEMDSRATANGRAGLRQLSAVSSAKDGKGMRSEFPIS